MRAAIPHSFHIPVMGTAFTIDAPVRVARYGISSAIQTDDILMEEMRGVLCEEFDEPYDPIPGKEATERPARVQAYLDLLDRIVTRQVESMKREPFAPGTDLTRFFELLPPGPLRTAYLEMRATVDVAARAQREDALREQVVPGDIEFNQMTKLDRDRFAGADALSAEWSDASTGLRAFVNSTVRGAVVFSAGLNPRLFSYAGQFDAFRPASDGTLAKRVVLKVSDYRSAVIQGRFLAKRGLWISEFRVESGLNCGGHAFGGDGNLLGPALERFKTERTELVGQLHGVYNKALTKIGREPLAEPLPVRITVQGGIGVAAEDRFLRRRYDLDGTGWGTPFLLVPEVTNVDPHNRGRLMSAMNGDVYLSSSSPLGIPFWNLRDSESERERQRRIDAGRPGSPCRRNFLKLFNTEFSERPLCLSSREYQSAKLREIDATDLPNGARESLRASVLQKSCICHDLAGGATFSHGIDTGATPAVCPGPNIVNFSRSATLDEMVDHIYGRGSLLTNTDRPHVLLRELELNVAYLRDQLSGADVAPRARATFVVNLREGIVYYEALADDLEPGEQDAFRAGLSEVATDLDAVATG